MSSALSVQLSTRGLQVGGALCVLAFAAAVAAPLLTYSLALATFGLAHVLYELRYVARRFGPRVSAGWLVWTGLCLVGVVGIRAGYLVDAWTGVLGIQAELALSAALALGVLPLLRPHGLGPALAAVSLAGAFVAGLLWAPVAALLAIAVAHNLTPVGFVAEALRGAERRRWLTVCALLFAGIPALIATGLPTTVAVALGLHHPDATVLSTGPLSEQLAAYLPGSWHAWPSATALFSAAVFAQCMHYLAVLHLFPALHERPHDRRFAGLVLTATLLLGAGYLQHFGDARAWYGLLAIVHASVEIPLLLLALAPAKRLASP